MSSFSSHFSTKADDDKTAHRFSRHLIFILRLYVSSIFSTVSLYSRVSEYQRTALVVGRVMNSDDKRNDEESSPTAEGSTETKTAEHPCVSLLSYYQEETFSAQVMGDTTIGTTLVANQFIPPGSLLFHLPLNHLITHDLVVATPFSKLIAEIICSANDDDDDDSTTNTLPPLCISPEALMWLNMVVWLNDTTTTTTGPHFPTNYLASLSTIPPNASSWPQSLLRDELMGWSNIYAVLDDASGGDNNNDVVVGNVGGAVNGLLALLDEMRVRIIKQQKIKMNKKQEEDGMEMGISNNNNKDDDIDGAMQILLCQEPSIFTHESISWARGHFLSRRFPDPRTSLLSQKKNKENDHTTTAPKDHHHHHLAGYGGELSVLIPFMDLMNHSFDKKNTCTIQIVTTTSATTGDVDGRRQEQQQVLEVRSGQVALQAGDELYYCYGEELSNEKLLQAYGFCVPNNPYDTISLKVMTNTAANSTAAAAATSSCTFSIQRGGVSSIPKEMWCAIAGVVVVDGHDEGGELEIGSGDLEQLLQYMTDKLKQLNTSDANKQKKTYKSIKEEKDENIILNQERLLYIEIYKKGQREILEELIRDITVMLSG